MTRKLKIYPQFRRLTYSAKIVPELRLSGIWLDELGFRVGKTVKVTARPGELIIKLSR